MREVEGGRNRQVRRQTDRQSKGERERVRQTRRQTG